MAIGINSANSISQAFKAMPTQINANKVVSSQQNEKSESINSSNEFSDVMNKALEAVEKANQAATNEANNLLTEQSTQLHSVVLAAEKADIALQMTLQIRNKALDAYQEIMRMQI